MKAASAGAWALASLVLGLVDGARVTLMEAEQHRRQGDEIADGAEVVQGALEEQQVRGVQMGKCILKGPSGSGLERHIGIEKGYCATACRAYVFTRQMGDELLEFEYDFVKRFKKKEEMIWNGQCHCMLVGSAKPVLPSYLNLDKCTPRDCWKFYKATFNVGVVNAWRPKTEGCGTECGTDCEHALIGPGIDDTGLQDLYRKNRREYDILLNNLAKARLAPPAEAREETPGPPECWWLSGAHPCEPSCDDGKTFTGSFTKQECFCKIGRITQRRSDSDCVAQGLGPGVARCEVQSCFQWACLDARTGHLAHLKDCAQTLTALPPA